ncbi:MAG: hypothetical protein OH339_00745 [Candidatus Parvarchaeota archaeon]|nr:hypothetical protein [Candidatus Haiyanarchaeum thermophilum]MCW1307866.1 hypothetical protein [Candidatus Haiyanarchaeum thermophilum]
MQAPTFYEIVCKFSKRFPLRGKARDHELEEALSFLEWRVGGEDVVNAARAILILSFLISSFLLIKWFMPLLLLLPFLAYYAFLEYPKSKARVKKMHYMAQYIEALAQIMSYLKINPNLEVAILRSIHGLRGKLKRELEEILRRASLSGNLKEELIRWSDSKGTVIRTSIYYVISSLSYGKKEERSYLLDRGFKLTLDSILSEFKKFSKSIYFPVLIIFSLSSTIPFLLISFTPFSAFFMSKGAQFFLLISPFILLLIVWAISSKLLEKRPLISFSSLPIPREMEERKLYFCLLVWFVIAFPGILSLINLLSSGRGLYLCMLIPMGLSIAFSLYHYLKVKDLIGVVRKNERMEEEILDFNYQLAMRVEGGRSVEEALSFYYTSFKHTEISKVMRRKMKLAKRLGLSLSEVFSKKLGDERRILSSKVRVCLGILKQNWKNSEMLTNMLLTITQYYGELKKLEMEVRDMLRQVIGMMRITSVFLAPIICGLVIGINEMLIFLAQKTRLELGFNFFLLEASLHPEVLYLVIGMYLLCLSYLLLKLSTALEFGEDKVRFSEAIYKSLPLTIFILLGSWIVTKWFFGVMI